MTEQSTKVQVKQGSNKKLIILISGIAIGVFLAILAMQFIPSLTFNSDNAIGSNAIIENEKKPLYWVAPMDANYRRDKPGKSPMGMDLIPYYGNSINQANDEGAGTISISPNVVNNLGVRTVSAKVVSLSNTVKAVGYVTYDEDKLVHIHPRVSGWIEKLYIDAIGEEVEKGQPLYDLYSPELVNAQEEFLLALSGNNSRLITAAQNKLTALKISLKTIKEIKQSKVAQQHITFYAPQSGVVESLTIRPGFYVMPETMILSIVDLSQVWVKADVFERDIAKIAMNDKASMTLDFLPAQQWQGKVEHIHPMLNPKSRAGIVRLHFNNETGALKPNMFAQIAITTATEKPVLQIPLEALIRTGNLDRVVLALGDGYFKSVEVQVGRSNQNYIEIVSGLSAGESVVSSAQFLLDSESSKTSDFQRMSHQELKNVPTATVHGTVVNIMAAHRMVVINREAIEKWNREAAQVNFLIDEGVDITLFQKNAYLMFTFEILADDFIITKAVKMTSTSEHGQHQSPQGNQEQGSLEQDND